MTTVNDPGHEPPGTSADVDPDTQCAVITLRDRGANRCSVRLSCRIHSEAQKKAVNDRTKPYDELLAQQPMALGLLETGGPRKPTKSTSKIIDLDINCGVQLENGFRCGRLLNCTMHSEQEKEDVGGRTSSFSNIMRIYNERRSKEAGLDTHCCVDLGNGLRCTHSLSCQQHNRDQKRQVTGRSMLFIELLRIQQSQSSPGIVATGGYGVAVAAARKDPGGVMASIRRRYRRDGLQTATFEPDPDAEVAEPFDAMHSPAGRNLNRLRQIMYPQDTANPEQSLSKILPVEIFAHYDEKNSKVENDGEAFRFCFVSKPSLLTRGGASLQKSVSNGTLKDCLVIVANHTTYGLSQTSADLVMAKLREYIGHFPLSPSHMNDVLQRLFLHHSLVAATVTVPYTIAQGIRDQKPCLVVELLNIDTTGSDAVLPQIFGVRTKVALPIHAQPNDVDVPDRDVFYNFQEQPFPPNANVSQTKQRKLLDIIEYIVSSLNLRNASQKQVIVTLAHISKDFGVPLLYRMGADTTSTIDPSNSELLIFDEAAGMLRPSPEVKAIVPHLPDLKIPRNPLAAHLIKQCFENRFRHTQDLVLAIADAANAADMMLRDPDLLINVTDMCSPGETSCELHRCMPCGSMVVCKSMKRILINGVEVPVCPNCRPPKPKAPATSGATSDGQGTGSSGTGDANTGRSNDAASKTGGSKTGGSKTGGSRTGRPPSSTPVEYSRVKANMTASIGPEQSIVYAAGEALAARQEERKIAHARLDDYWQTLSSGSLWQWLDDYFDTPITNDTGLLQASVEAYKPLLIYNGRAREHVGPNVGITTLYANKLCGTFPSIALKVLYELDHADTEAEEDVYIDYADSIHLIRSQIPFTTKQRFAGNYTDAFAAEFDRQCHSGVATADACLRIQEQDTKVPYLWRIKLNWVPNDKSNLPQIHEVETFVTDLEKSSGRLFRRINTAPYPFKGGPDPDWNWSMLYGFFSHGFSTLRRWCNARHITTFDLPRLICAILFLLHNRRTAPHGQLLDLPVCIYTRHLLGASVGKYDHAKGMTTGFLENEAITLANLNLEFLNLCVEPWVANSAKGNRDDEIEAIRSHFRSQLKQENLPFWPAKLGPLLPDVMEKYVKLGTATDYTDYPRGGGGGDDDGSGSGDNSGGAGGGAGGGGVQRWAVVPSRRNMANLGVTCYLSVVVQLLYSFEEFRRVADDDSQLIYKEATGLGDAQYIPHDEVLSDLSPEEVVEFRKVRLSNVRLLMELLRKIFKQLDAGGIQLPRSWTEQILKRINAIDNRWKNETNESAELSNLLIECAIMASDKSSTTGRGSLKRLADQQEADNQQGRLLFPVGPDSNSYWADFRREGHETALTDVFYTQFVLETPCPQADCPVISRSFESSHIIYLDLPSTLSELDTASLTELLGNFVLEELSGDAGHQCERDSSHERGVWNYRCFTRPAKYICFAIRRGGVGQVHNFTDVTLPEDLDLSDYTNHSALPSVAQPQGEEGPAQQTQMMYDLVGVNNWINNHYIGYVKQKQAADGDVWVMFNDLHGKPTSKTPFEGFDEGELVHYAVYKRRTDPDKAANAGTTTAKQSGQPGSGQGQGGTRNVRPRLDQGKDGQSAKEAELKLREQRLQERENQQMEKDQDLARRLAELELREQQMEHLQQRAIRATFLETNFTDLISRRNGFRSQIDVLIQDLQAKEQDLEEQIRRVDNTRESIVAAIEELNSQLTTLRANLLQQDQYRAGLVQQLRQLRSQANQQIQDLRDQMLRLFGD